MSTIVAFEGRLSSGPAKLREDQSSGLQRGLKEAGFAEGENLIQDRGADGHYDRLKSVAAELVSRKDDVIATAGGPAAGIASKSATTTILIEFVTGVRPGEDRHGC